MSDDDAVQREALAQRTRERAERLAQFIQDRYGGNKTRFGEAAGGMIPQRVNDHLSGESNVGAEVLVKFMMAGLNPIWYLTGVGVMDYDVAALEATADRSMELRRQVLELVGLVEALRGGLGEVLVKI